MFIRESSQLHSNGGHIYARGASGVGDRGDGVFNNAMKGTRTAPDVLASSVGYRSAPPARAGSCGGPRPRQRLGPTGCSGPTGGSSSWPISLPITAQLRAADETSPEALK